MGSMERSERLSFISTVLAGLIFVVAGFAASALADGVLQGFAYVAAASLVIALLLTWRALVHLDIYARTPRRRRLEQQLIEKYVQEQAANSAIELRELDELHRLAVEMEALTGREREQRHPEAWRRVRVLTGEIEDLTEGERERLRQMQKAILEDSLPTNKAQHLFELYRQSGEQTPKK